MSRRALMRAHLAIAPRLTRACGRTGKAWVRWLALRAAR
jgi:hypothetical protein